MFLAPVNYNNPNIADIAFENEQERNRECIKECMDILIDNRTALKRSELRQQDTIDVTAYGTGQEGLTDSTIIRSNEEIQKLDDNWFLGIPPLEMAVLKINRDRYFMYEVEDLDIENKSYTINITDYCHADGIWVMHAVYKATYCFNDINIIREVTGFGLGGMLECMFTAKESPYKTFLPEKTKKVLIENVIPGLDRIIDTEIAYNIATFFLSLILKVNIELSSGVRPKAKRGSRKKAIASVNEDALANPKPQIVRTLKSGVTIKSVKMPKAPTMQSVTHYKVASWNCRGHIRHCKSGKVTYVRPSVKERQCLKKNGEAPKSRTVILAGC